MINLKGYRTIVVDNIKYKWKPEHPGSYVIYDIGKNKVHYFSDDSPETMGQVSVKRVSEFIKGLK